MPQLGKQYKENPAACQVVVIVECDICNECI